MARIWNSRKTQVKGEKKNLSVVEGNILYPNNISLMFGGYLCVRVRVRSDLACGQVAGVIQMYKPSEMVRAPIRVPWWLTTTRSYGSQPRVDFKNRQPF